MLWQALCIVYTAHHHVRGLSNLIHPVLQVYTFVNQIHPKEKFPTWNLTDARRACASWPVDKSCKCVKLHCHNSWNIVLRWCQSGTVWHFKLDKEVFPSSVQEHWHQRLNVSTTTWVQLLWSSSIMNSLKHVNACIQIMSKNINLGVSAGLYNSKSCRNVNLVLYSHSYLTTKESPRGNRFTHYWTRLAPHS